LTQEQVMRGPKRRPTLAELLAEGARVVAGGEAVDRQTRLYPLGTARALAYVLRHCCPEMANSALGRPVSIH
jgi:hypothetical protein